MDKLYNAWWFGGPDDLNEPGVTNYLNDNHIFTMISLIAIVFVLSILIYIAVKRQKINKAPNAAIVMVESMIITGDNFCTETHEGRFDRANPYLISLFIFFLFGNMISLVGVVPIGSSIAAIFAATAVTWISTIGIGLAYNKWHYVLKLLNPIEAASNFSPLISLTFRMYGNIIGGVVLVTLCSIFLDNIWIKIIGATVTNTNVEAVNNAATLNPLGVLFLPAINLYFDVFDDTIQAFVFMILTISYWFQASEVDIKDKHRDKIKIWKKQIIKNKEQEKGQVPLSNQPGVNENNTNAPVATA